MTIHVDPDFAISKRQLPFESGALPPGFPAVEIEGELIVYVRSGSGGDSCTATNSDTLVGRVFVARRGAEPVQASIAERRVILSCARI
jgi:hypothetical protein